MKKIFLLLVLASTFTWAQTKKVTKSEVHWWGYKVAKTEASSHNGTLNVKSGEFVMNGRNVVGGTFVLDMNSINATDLSGEMQTKLNGHLKKGDFFETDVYPTGVFKITSVTKNKDKNFPQMVNGNLTLKGKTLPISFPAYLILNGKTLKLHSSKFSIDRQKFGINYQSSMKDVLVKDEMDIEIKVEAQ